LKPLQNLAWGPDGFQASTRQPKPSGVFLSFIFIPAPEPGRHFVWPPDEGDPAFVGDPAKTVRRSAPREGRPIWP